MEGINPVKIIGVGLTKTGTTSLGDALRHWGYKHCSLHREAFAAHKAGNIAEVLRYAGEYESYEDWPWNMAFKELDAQFPGSKFILTMRSTPEMWFDSLCKHSERTGYIGYREFYYGYEMPHQHRAHFLEFYEKRNQAVRDYFAHRPNDFIELCWEKGQGWKELAEFLGREDIPTIPFPHSNQRPPKRTLLERVQGRLKRILKK
ncbi:MAG: sulfotransferase [Candidatus Sumerlaeia bacterium]|nr:sulfotransferase [Candidatus Sumerlaeia bacterium]